ncbi:MAG: hypothetical protein U0T32_12380 [Chitinophagales bacterium]
MRILSLLFAVLLMSSCKKEKSNCTDYIVFGTYYGECGGEQCIELYKLTSTELFEDSKDNYPATGIYNGTFSIKRSVPDFALVSNFESTIPTSLLNDTSAVIGCPDCADGGGVYLEYHKNGIHKVWHIDRTLTLPSDYALFINQVAQKIQALK